MLDVRLHTTLVDLCSGTQKSQSHMILRMYLPEMLLQIHCFTFSNFH